MGFESIARITLSDYDKIAKEVKTANEVYSSPSRQWMCQQGYLAKIQVEGKRAFWVFTETGREFAGLLVKKDKEIVFGARACSR